MAPAGFGNGAPRQRRQRRTGGPELADEASTFRNCQLVTYIAGESPPGIADGAKLIAYGKSLVPNAW